MFSLSVPAIIYTVLCGLILIAVIKVMAGQDATILACIVAAAVVMVAVKLLAGAAVAHVGAPAAQLAAMTVLWFVITLVAVQVICSTDFMTVVKISLVYTAIVFVFTFLWRFAFHAAIA